MRIIIEIDDRSVPIEGAESSQQAAAVNAGGPPAALLERLGAPPRAASATGSTSTATAVNAGGPPPELLLSDRLPRQ